jgi:hypothetical protein
MSQYATIDDPQHYYMNTGVPYYSCQGAMHTDPIAGDRTDSTNHSFGSESIANSLFNHVLSTTLDLPITCTTVVMKPGDTHSILVSQTFFRSFCPQPMVG